MKRKIIQLIVLTAAATIFGHASAQNLLTNGSFESPLYPDGAIVQLQRGDLLPGWLIENGFVTLNVDTNSFAPSNPPDGKQYLAFNAGNTTPNAVISQQVGLNPRVYYRVSFSVGRAGTGPGDVALRAIVVDAEERVLGGIDAIAPAYRSWGEVQSFVFQARDSVARLRFIDVSTVTTAVDVLLDDVRLTPVSTPGFAGAKLVADPSIFALLDAEQAYKDLVAGKAFQATTNVAIVEGLVGNGYQFNWPNSYLSYQGASVSNLTQNFTFHAWIKWNGIANQVGIRDQTLFSIETGFFALLIIEPDEPQANPFLANSVGSLVGTVPGYTYMKTALYPPVGQWFFLAVVKEGTNYAVYLNGLKRWEGTAPQKSVPPSKLVVSNPDPFPFQGVMDEVAFYTAPLSEAAIKAIYLAGTRGLVKKPTLLSISTQAGGIHLIGGSIPGRRLTLYQSTNLTAWSTVLFMNTPGGKFETNLPAGLSKAFFRLSE